MADTTRNSGKWDERNGPGTDKGVPDDAKKGEATGLPHSEREDTEKAVHRDA
ncbi:hypothetical protein NFI95_09830 [Acetobacteraceae bacterium KSS8]|uniref:Uncharacterized protein n=1 Tax=Endosaccharibacter trunci TaxID=2812733 RepID=A0ABT1W794_9PROT|nr:hypothetical protein [Acetobacteraceae bacterium KSS8]